MGRKRIDKSKNIELKEQNLEFLQEGVLYKLKLFRPASMTVDVSVYEDGKFIKNDSIAFAHLPKNLKRILKPN
jgi:hypothetical protein